MRIPVEWLINAYQTNLFVPEDALPEDLMSNWSNVADMTAGEYAAQKGLTIVNVGGGIRNTDVLGIMSCLATATVETAQTMIIF